MRLKALSMLLLCGCPAQPRRTESVDSGATLEKTQDAGAHAPQPRAPEDLHPIRIDGKYGYFDETGAIAIEPQFDVARHFSEGVAAAGVGDLWGYINPEGRFVIAPQFAFAFDFSSGLAGVKISKDRYGYIDLTGRLVIDPKFSFPGAFHEGVAPVTLPSDRKAKAPSAALVNRLGEIVAGGFDSIGDYEAGSFGACQARTAQRGSSSPRCGRISPKGAWVVAPSYESTWAPQADVMAGCLAANNCGLFPDDGGTIRAGPAALWIGPPSAGLYAVGLPTKPPRFGFVDSTGGLRINPVFDYVAPFQEGVAAAVKEGRLGFIGTDGKWVIPPTLQVGSMFAVIHNEDGFEADLDWSWAMIEATMPVDGSNFHRGVAHVTTNDGKVRTNVHIDASGRVLRVEPLLFGDWRDLPEVNDKAAAASGQRVKQNRTGTAFVASSAGHLVTSAHVVDGCANVWVESPRAEARVVAIDRTNDLALLEAGASISKGTAPLLVTSEPVRIGERAFVFGFAFTGLLATGGTFTEGSISARSGMGNNSSHLQISAPLQPGNSGGAVLDQRGVVVGVVASKLDALKVAALVGDVPQNVNFAVKASVLREFLWAANIDIGAANDAGVLESAAIAEVARKASVRIRCE